MAGGGAFFAAAGATDFFDFGGGAGGAAFTFLIGAGGGFLVGALRPADVLRGVAEASESDDEELDDDELSSRNCRSALRNATRSAIERLLRSTTGFLDVVVLLRLVVAATALVGTLGFFDFGGILYGVRANCVVRREPQVYFVHEFAKCRRIQTKIMLLDQNDKARIHLWTRQLCILSLS
jgi:hypothetical protein